MDNSKKHRYTITPMPEEPNHMTEVDEASAGQRLDKFLTASLPDLSRTRLQSLIEEECVFCGDIPVSQSAQKVKAGEIYTVIIPEPEPTTISAKAIPLSIVYEDDDMLVIDKAAGMTVHPGAGNYNDTMVNALLHHCGDSLSGIGGVARPGIVHRLDKDTSGLMVVAKHDKAHVNLAKQIETRALKRIYFALMWGIPSPSQGLIVANIGRSSRNRKKMAVLKEGGKHAVTHYKVLEAFGLLASAVECRLETGRTHQIRIHFTDKGHALIGDQVYGNTRLKNIKGLPEEAQKILGNFPRQALHSSQIGFTQPITKEPMEFLSPLPEDIQTLYDTLKGIF